MAKHPIPTPEILRQLLDYRPETGKLFWREREGNARWNTGYAGKEALRPPTAMDTFMVR